MSATFNEQLQPEFAAMTVVGPDGNLWSTGDPQVQGAVIAVGVRPLGPAGTYTVNYRVTSADGHAVSGSWSFRLTVAATGTPGPSAAALADSGGDGGIPVWPFLVAGALIIGGGILVGGTTKDVTRRAARRSAVSLVVCGASAAAWALTYPQAAPAATLVRAVADCAARRHARAGGGADARRRAVPGGTHARAGRPLAVAAGRLAVRRAVSPDRGRRRGRRGARSGGWA